MTLNVKFSVHHKNVWLFRGASQVVLMIKNPPANAGDIGYLGSVPGLGRSPGEANGKSL